jgi:hypothetical protein
MLYTSVVFAIIWTRKYLRLFFCIFHLEGRLHYTRQSRSRRDRISPLQAKPDRDGQQAPGQGILFCVEGVRNKRNQNSATNAVNSSHLCIKILCDSILSPTFGEIAPLLCDIDANIFLWYIAWTGRQIMSPTHHGYSTSRRAWSTFAAWAARLWKQGGYHN